jgi:hypothetical protein
MEFRVYLAVLCAGMFLFCSVSAAGISLNEVISGGTQDSGISIPTLPPPTEGSVLQRKALDTQPYIFKTSDRLLHEAEIGRDIAKEQLDAAMAKYTAEVNQKHGTHYTVEKIKYEFLRSPDPLYTPEMIEALDSYKDANKKYNAALAATGEKEYERKARIFESASDMYAGMGATEAMEITRNAATAARAQAAAQRISLPFPAWIAVCGILGGFFLIQRKRK